MRYLVPVAMSVTAVGATHADTISPDAFSAALELGETITLSDTVTVDAGRPDSALLDVVFLVDTSGSMGGVIGGVRDNASEIIDEISSFGDVQFGVTEYRDIFDTVPLSTATALTSDTDAVQAGINSLFATGGGDLPELNFGGLTTVAEDTPWREDSTRVLVWFGDAIGHDPREFDGTEYTEAGAISSLLSEGVIVQAVDSRGLDSTGQATRVAEATGGDVFDIAGSGAGVTEAIIAGIDSSFLEYSSVALGVSGAAGCADVGVGSGVTGDFDRSVDRTFDFDVSLTRTGTDACSFDIDALVDGGLVASQTISFAAVGTDDPVGPTPTDPMPSPVPLPAAGWMLLASLGGLGFARRHSARRK